jgi:hypothetical protein
MPTLIVSLMFSGALSLAAQQAPALKIVVVEGEGGVNIIQQKTAVRPLVEVRDRNNLPVAGASVTFTIGGGGQSAAFAGGVQTLTVTTNAAGQAAASGLNAIGSGAFQIQVSAAYQGQIATAAISQTNFATAAAAAQAGASAGGGGGGISGTTIAIVGAAVGGGAIAATQVVNKDEEGGSKNASATYTGSFNGQQVVSTTTASAGGSSTCVSTRPVIGTLEITLINGGSQFGGWKMTGTRSESSVTGPNCTPQPGPIQLNMGGEVTGSPSDMTFTTSSTGTGPTPNGGGSVTVTEKTGFRGSLSGNTITGTLVHEQSTNGNNVFNGVSSTITGGGSVSIPITLSHQ